MSSTVREPRHPEAWGWRERITGSGESTRQEWRPQGRCVGWLDESGLYLEPAAAFQAVQQFGSSSGTSLTVSAPTLWKRMDEAGLLQSTERDGLGTRYVRRMFASSRRKVLHLAVDVFDDPAGESATSEPALEAGTAAGQSARSVRDATQPQTDRHMQAKLPLESGSGQSGECLWIQRFA